jgi:hypothetical protein
MLVRETGAAMYGTYERLRVRVFAPNMEVIRAARSTLKPKARRDPNLREERKHFYRQMLNHHDIYVKSEF